MNDSESSAADDSGSDRSGPESLTDVRFVGPATARELETASVTPADVLERRVSYRDLVDVGVNPGVAARIRREHSLPWSFDSSGGDLDRRSTQVRGLDDDERAWVAASAGDWEATAEGAAEADGSGDPEAAEATWRERSAPDPVTVLAAVDSDDAAERLADAGVTSVRRLSTVDPERVSDAIGTDVERVREWYEAARAHRQ